MITQVVEPNPYHQKARQIKTRVPTILSQWGLPAKFSRWRLTQDPDSGMVVLFAVLNSAFIAANTATPSSDYFDPRLLHDLANDLHLQIVSSNSDGLRYAFILDRGSLDESSSPSDQPTTRRDGLLAGVVYNGEPAPGWLNPQTLPAPHLHVEIVDDPTPASQGLASFLEALDNGTLAVDASRPSSPSQPRIVVISEEAFKKQATENKATRRWRDHLRELFDQSGQ